MDANRGNGSRGPALYHLQIPHTASAPLRRLLASRFPPESICPALHSLHLLEIPRERFSQFDFFSGHLQFGYHLPAMLGRPVQVVTMLRDPRAILFSRYKQVSQDPIDPMRDHMDEHCPTIEAFFSCGLMGAYVANPLVWHLGRWERTLDLHYQEKLAATADPEEISKILSAATAEYSPRVDELRDRARERLESCAFVGLVERMDESLAKLSKVLGGPPLVAAPNIEGLAEERTVADLPASLVERIEAFATWDLPLYDEFARRFDAL